MEGFDKTIGFELGAATCKRCKKEFPYNALRAKPLYCSVECEQIVNDYKEDLSVMKLKNMVLDKAKDEYEKIIEHVYDVGYADGMESRQEEIDVMTEELVKEKKKVEALKEFLEKI